MSQPSQEAAAWTSLGDQGDLIYQLCNVGCWTPLLQGPPCPVTTLTVTWDVVWVQDSVQRSHAGEWRVCLAGSGLTIVSLQQAVPAKGETRQDGCVKTELLGEEGKAGPPSQHAGPREVQGKKATSRSEKQALRVPPGQRA